MRRSRGPGRLPAQGTHLFSSGSSASVAALPHLPDAHTQWPVVPQDVREIHGSPMLSTNQELQTACASPGA
ncbi:hypothetical protein NDU88_000853 [Pleurodeles waltl]|uniref:Uncharacterized protein n=1 Tax=Pleurodeles waltl TaxID=8319 RepID=A0AAV7MT15_PLEWA|nr:hypothetical protein NDU88_000853 [Pleurodeles waltl]